MPVSKGYPINMKHSLQDHLEVTETDNAVKVQSDGPHLVSLGSGRLSTAVTILPIQQGFTRIGTKHATQPQDILVEGTGIEDQHCAIENNFGVITFHPIGERCSVDSRMVSSPIRLSQGKELFYSRIPGLADFLTCHWNLKYITVKDVRLYLL